MSRSSKRPPGYVTKVHGKWVRLISIEVNGDKWWTDEAFTLTAPTPNELGDRLRARPEPWSIWELAA